MNKVIPAFICVAFILMLTGCKKKKFNDAIYDTIGQKIEMYKPQNKMFHFCKTFCSKITLVNTIQNVILNPI